MPVEIKNQYQDIPTPELVKAVTSRALEVAGENVDDINFQQAGLFMTSYSYLFNAGPLSQPDAFERLPVNAQDSLGRVAEACALVVESSQDDPWPLDPELLSVKEDPETGEDYIDIGQLFNGVQSALQVRSMPEPQMRAIMEEEEVEAIVTGSDTTASGFPLRKLTGPTNASMKAVRDLVLVAGEEFGSVFGGCEIIADEADRRFQGIIPSIAQTVSAQWQHPEWVPYQHNAIEFW